MSSAIDGGLPVSGHRADTARPSPPLAAYLWAIAGYWRMSLGLYALMIALALWMFWYRYRNGLFLGDSEIVALVMVTGYGMFVAQTRNFFTTWRAGMVPGLRFVHLLAWLTITALFAAAMYPVIQGVLIDVRDAGTSFFHPSFSVWGVIGVTLCVLAAMAFALQSNARLIALIIAISVAALMISTLTREDAQTILTHLPTWEKSVLAVGMIWMAFDAWELYRLNEDRRGYQFGRLEFSMTRRFDTDVDTRRRFNFNQDKGLSRALLKLNDWQLDRAVGLGSRMVGWGHLRWTLATPAFNGGRAVIFISWAAMFALFSDKQVVGGMTIVLSYFIAWSCLLLAHVSQPLAFESLKPVSRTAFLFQIGWGRLQQHLITLLFVLLLLLPCFLQGTWFMRKPPIEAWLCFSAYLLLNWLLLFAVHLWIAMFRSRVAIVGTSIFVGIFLTLFGTISSLATRGSGSPEFVEIEFLAGMLGFVVVLLGAAAWRWQVRELND